MMDLPPRKVLFCVSERALDNAAAFTWATKCLFEPRDAVTFVFVRVESGDTLTRRVLHSVEPPLWLPTEIAAQLADSDTVISRPKFVEIVSDLSPGDALAEFLAENDEPLRTVAVLGSRGHTGIKKLVFGSSAARLVSRDVVPCVVVRSTLASPPEPDLPPPTPPHACRHVAIAVDSTPSGAALCAWAGGSLLRPTDRVTLLHGRGDHPATPDAEAAAVATALSTLKSAVASLGSGGSAPSVPEPKVAVLSGSSPGAALVAWCDAHRPDMLVAGSRGPTGRGALGLGLGSVSSHAVSFAPCPVLVVNAATLGKLTSATALKRATMSDAEAAAAGWTPVSDTQSVGA